MFLDNSACNLASLNLLTYLEDGKFNVAKYHQAVDVFMTAMEIIIDFASYPTDLIAKNSHEFRPLGLGYANLGTVLMMLGIPYDSEEGRAWAASLTAIHHNRAYYQSAKIASNIGPFIRYQENKEPFLGVIQKHRDAAFAIDTTKAPDYLIKAAREDADNMLDLTIKNGVRNSQATNIAPTGTIGLLMDCDTTGIEPDFALVKFKKLAGGGFFKIVNQSVPEALGNLGYSKEQIDDIIVFAIGTASFTNAPFINNESLLNKGLTQEDIDNIESKLKGVFELEQAFTIYNINRQTLEKLQISEEKINDPKFRVLEFLGYSDQEIESANKFICGSMTVEGAPHLKEEHLAVFDCANKCGRYSSRFIAAMGHVKMMAAVQPFISGAISKTVNLPYEATVQEIKDTYVQAWRLGVKAIAIYRDGSKGSQPLSTTVKKEDKKIETRIEYRPMRRRLPDERNAITHKFSIAGHRGFLTVGIYEDGTPGEIFIIMNKEGTVISGLLDSFATSISYALQYGVPLRDLVNKFAHMRFEPSGFTTNTKIPIAKSIIDYIFRWMAIKFLPRKDWQNIGIHVDEENLNDTVAPKETNSTNNSQESLSFNPPPTDTRDQDPVHYDVTGDAPTCDSCGGMMTRSGTCYKCMNCGSTSGCS